MASRTIKSKRTTRVHLPFAPDSQAARSLRPTERALEPLPPEPPEIELLEAVTPSDAITIESEVIWQPSPETRRRRHQSQANLELERRTRRQTRDLPGRGWV